MRWVLILIFSVAIGCNDTTREKKQRAVKKEKSVTVYERSHGYDIKEFEHRGCLYLDIYDGGLIHQGACTNHEAHRKNNNPQPSKGGVK